jgi:glycosyltransferase involved in cell wall biosynthesis
MKVAIDVSPLKTGHQYRGIGAYTDNLAKSFRSTKIHGFSFQLIEKEKIPKDCDLIHYPYFDLFFLTLPIKKLKPTVVTIHDVIPLVFPEHFPVGLRGSLKFQIQKKSLKNVKAVITDSENSKRDIFKYLNYPKEKIYIVPLAPADDFKKLEIGNWKLEIKQKYQLPDNFVLYVGDVNYNKNIPGLIKAFSRFLLQTSEHSSRSSFKLVLVGKAFLDENLKEAKEILQLINSLKLSKKIVRLGWIPTEDLVGIYNLATVYCQPSFYEGFGLPVLEAMACGCPVVAAKTSSLPEICGEAAVMVDPYNINNMAMGIKKVIDDKKELINKGFKQVRQFSWERVAKETYEVYQKVV